MATKAKTAWGVDVGNHTLKAVKLTRSGDEVEVLDFAVIQHEKILSQPDLEAEERAELISKALTQFLDEHEIGGTSVVVSVPGQNSFARFIKLPPVENKRIPEIVRFEAIQQIPFDINDVEWDWQAFQLPNSPEAEVGIFAIKRQLVRQALEPFAQADCPVHLVQMAPMALYNFLCHDHQNLRTTASKEAIVLLEIGAENSDLVIADGIRVWQRSIPIGGNQFTTAVQKSFKLGFAKAEAIKCSANTSKYARQIFQAMRSVFADLAAEIQRSLGFYSSGNREVQFRKLIALGNAMKLPGLAKFLQQSLSLPVKRLDSFESIKMSPEVSIAHFTENVPSLAIAYGLAIQGIGLGAIESNLLPREIARQSQWKQKRKWFAVAVAVFMVSTLIYLVQALSQKNDLESSATQKNIKTVQNIKNEISKGITQKEQLLSKIKAYEAEIAQHVKFYQPEMRNLLPQLLQAIRECLPNEKNLSDPRQIKLHQDFNAGEFASITAIPRNERQQVFISSIQMAYTDNLDEASLNELTGQRVRAQTRSQTQTSTRLSRTSMGAQGPMGPEGPMGPAAGPAAGMGRPAGPAIGRPAGPAIGRPAGPAVGMGRPAGPAGGTTNLRPSVVRTPGIFSQQVTTGSRAVTEGAVKGFLVVIEGTTPNKDGFNFLMTPDVDISQRDKWGFFNRLRYLGKTDEQIIAEAKASSTDRSSATARTADLSKPAFPALTRDPNYAGLIAATPSTVSPEVSSGTSEKSALSPAAQGNLQNKIIALPFETYVDPKVENIEVYFDPSQGGWLTTDTSGGSEQPDLEELGVLKVRKESSPLGAAYVRTSLTSDLKVYLDPLTNEPISVTYVRDKDGQLVIDTATNSPKIERHDYWFRLKFKVKIKEKSPDKKVSEV